MYDIVLLTLGAEPAPGARRTPGTSGAPDAPGAPEASGVPDAAGASGGPGGPGARPRPRGLRAPVLACVEALTAAGARVETITAGSDGEIDTALARFDGPPRADGLAWPDPDGKTRLVVASATDAQLRAVVRRLVRRYAPPPSRRPADLASSRTVPDLPPIGVLPLGPAPAGPVPGGSVPGGSVSGRSVSGGPARIGPAPAGAAPAAGDLVGQLGLPRTPAAVAEAVLAGRVRRLDLLRNDGGSVTLDGALIGGADETGRPLPWRGRVEVDDAVLSDGGEPVLAAAIGNAGGYATLDGVALLGAPDAADGVVEVAVAVPAVTRSRWRRTRVRLEVRRARGRAVAVTPRDGGVPFLDDGVTGELARKRSWWVEPGAWAVYELPADG